MNADAQARYAARAAADKADGADPARRSALGRLALKTVVKVRMRGSVCVCGRARAGPSPPITRQFISTVLLPPSPTHTQEAHAQPVLAVEYSPDDATSNLFATVGGDQVSERRRGARDFQSHQVGTRAEKRSPGARAPPISHA